MLGRIKPGDDVQVVHGSYEEGRFVALTGRAGRSSVRWPSTSRAN